MQFIYMRLSVFTILHSSDINTQVTAACQLTVVVKKKKSCVSSRLAVVFLYWISIKYWITFIIFLNS